MGLFLQVTILEIGEGAGEEELFKSAPLFLSLSEKGCQKIIEKASIIPTPVAAAAPKSIASILSNNLD